MSDARGSFDEIAHDEPFEGVVRRSFSSDRATVTSYTFTAGACFPLHRHPQEQITLVQTGDVEMTIGERIESLSAGDWTIVAPDIQHGLRAGPDGARILAIVVPRRASADAYSVIGSVSADA